MTPVKWLFTALIFFFLIFFIIYTGLMQNTATSTTAEAEALADSVLSGVLRGEIDEKGATYGDPEYMIKKEISTQLMNSLSFAQKQHPYEIEIAYVFLDDRKNVTEDEKKMKMLHFRIYYKDKEGTIKGTAERTLALDALLKN